MIPCVNSSGTGCHCTSTLVLFSTFTEVSTGALEGSATYSNLSFSKLSASRFNSSCYIEILNHWATPHSADGIYGKGSVYVRVLWHTIPLKKKFFFKNLDNDKKNPDFSWKMVFFCSELCVRPGLSRRLLPLPVTCILFVIYGDRDLSTTITLKPTFSAWSPP